MNEGIQISAEQIEEGILYKAEYHIGCTALVSKREVINDFMIKQIMTSLKSEIANKMVNDVIAGLGGRGIQLGDVWRYNHTLQGSAIKDE